MSRSQPPDAASPLEPPDLAPTRRPDPRLVAQLLAGGVRPGGVLLVHTSFRAVRGDQPIEGGPLGLIHALHAALGPGGTLVMPTMTDGETPFDPRTTATTDMGITAETFWRQPGVVRSTHPAGSFAALGPHAARICAEQPLSPPHGPDSPVGRVHELDGQVLLLGVTHSENTTLHLAEALAAVPYATSSDARLCDGTVVSIAEPNHCCNNFRLADGWLRAGGLQRDFVVGAGPARLFSARALVALAVPRLTAEPLLFLCPPAAACAECDLARASAAR